MKKKKLLTLEALFINTIKCFHWSLAWKREEEEGDKDIKIIR